MLIFLLITTGLFDFLSIYDSVTDNYGLCQDTDLLDYKIHSTMQSFQIKCYTSLFQLTGFMTLLSAFGIYYTTIIMKKYRSYISIDNL